MDDDKTTGPPAPHDLHSGVHGLSSTATIVVKKEENAMDDEAVASAEMHDRTSADAFPSPVDATKDVKMEPQSLATENELLSAQTVNEEGDTTATKIKLELKPDSPRLDSSTHSPFTTLPQDIAAILDFVQLPSEPPATVATDSTPVHTPADPAESILVDATPPAQTAPEVSMNKPKHGATAAEDSSSESSSSSSSDWDSSSDSEPEQSNRARVRTKGGPPAAATNYDDENFDEDTDGKPGRAGISEIPTTTNEILVPDVSLPSIARVGDDEVMDQVGELLSVIDSVVVVKGVPGSVGEKVLDTGSLLVWDDRTVLGEIFETFGPTHLPMYSIRFPSASAEHIPPSIFLRGRKVFHIPKRSNYVFTRHLHIKGSDASNQHDEEVVGSDLEDFSDDEQEQLWKARRKGKGRERRESQKPTDDGDYPFTSSYYDTDVPPPGSSATPGRAAPAPYDDDFGGLPYDGNEADDDAMSVSSSVAPTSTREYAAGSRGRGGFRGRGTSRGRGFDRERGRGRGRGQVRGRGRGPSDFQRQAPSRSHPAIPNPPSFNSHPNPHSEYDPHHAQLPIHHGNAYMQPPPFFQMQQQPYQLQQQQQQQAFGGAMGGHINPNFFAASMMGMGMGMSGMGGMGWGFPPGMAFGMGMMPGQQGFGYTPGPTPDSQGGNGNESGNGTGHQENNS